MMKRSLLILGVLLTVVSCGKKTSTVDKERNILDQTAAKEIVPLKKQKEICELRDFAQTSTIQELNFLNDGQMEEKSFDFSSMLKGITLGDDQSLSDGIYNLKGLIKNTNGRLTFTDYSNPKVVTICPEVREFEKDTVESVALHAAVIIDRTFSKFKTLNSDIEVKPISLQIGPIIAELDVKTSEMTFKADNAYYTPLNGSITFLPHSVAWKSLYSLSFWEVPMITSHEYGHHLFQSIYQEDVSTITPQECFSSPLHSVYETSEKSSRKVTASNVLSAYNEGFADLIAFYTLGRSEGSVDGVKCLETNRDITRSYFHYLIPKKFTKDMLEAFFSTKTLPRSPMCEYPSFQDDHVLGAIFAHSADRILSLMTTSQDEKLVALVAWVKYLKTLKGSSKYQDPQNYLEETFKKFITLSAAKFHAPYDTALCSEVESLFPGLELTECALR